MLKRIRDWYDGKPYFNSSTTKVGDRRVVVAAVMGTDYSRSARLAHALVGFYLAHWKWLWTFAIGVAGIGVALLRG
ncbi:hypothetical protein [Luteimonas sp. A482]